MAQSFRVMRMMRRVQMLSSWTTRRRASTRRFTSRLLSTNIQAVHYSPSATKIATVYYEDDSSEHQRRTLPPNVLVNYWNGEQYNS